MQLLDLFAGLLWLSSVIFLLYLLQQGIVYFQLPTQAIHHRDKMQRQQMKKLKISRQIESKIVENFAMNEIEQADNIWRGNVVAVLMKCALARQVNRDKVALNIGKSDGESALNTRHQL